MRTARRSVPLLLAVTLAGCFVDRAGGAALRDGGARPVDASTLDAAAADAGSADAGSSDAGAPPPADAAAVDAAEPPRDAGGPAADAGLDAGPRDGGTDAAVAPPALDPLLVELPCGSTRVASGRGCDMTASPDDAATFRAGGSAPVSVGLRVRAVAELQPYDGTSGGTGYWREGGTPRASSWTVMRLTISDPAATYHLNHDPAMEGRCFALDYTIPVSIRPGATVTLHGDDGDGVGWRNLDDGWDPVSVPGPVPVGQPYDGQFVYVTLE